MGRMRRLTFLLLFCLPLVALGDSTFQAASFSWQGQAITLQERTFACGDTALVLRDGDHETVVSAPLGGENYLLRTVTDTSGYAVLWLNSQEGNRRLALYESRTGETRLLPPTGFRSFPQVEAVLADGLAREVYFLGERDRSVDLHHLDLGSQTLTRLTRSPQCLRSFLLSRTPAAATIEYQTRNEVGRLTYSTQNRQVRASERRSRPQAVVPSPAQATSHPASYYNTYIGFGDSITWGQISGEQDPLNCFMSQIGHALSPLWGTMVPVNLGMAATTSYCGVWRITKWHDLDEVSGKYFLLMYGFNDTRRTPWDESTEWAPEPDPCPSVDNPNPGPNHFCLAYSRENIEIMVDEALARGMDVIVSTLTPRKDEPFVSQSYFWENLHGLSDAIVELAAERGIRSIDTLSAFLSYNPPEGWKDLLEEPGWTEDEDGEPVEIKGNHPNAAGHRIIADLYVAALKDIHPPSVSISEAPTTAWAGESTRLTATATAFEDATIASVNWTFSNESLTETGTTVTHPLVGENEAITVTATATDTKGRRSSASVTVQVKTLYAPATTARKIHVRTVIYDRDAWLVTWVPDARNAAAGYQVTEYWVYRIDAGGHATRIARVAANATLRYLDLGTFSATDRFTVVAADSEGHTSPRPAGS